MKDISQPQKVVDDLNATEDRESSEEAHCASNKTQLGLQSNLRVWVCQND